jgi:L-methionine (R)-S-oxide reductase
MNTEKSAVYDELARQLAALIEDERDLVANSANMAALIYHGLPDLNWAGFYFTRTLSSPPPHAGEGRVGTELVLGPFQGKPACIRIPWGEGVCGTAAARGAAIVVPDVQEFPGHIACDPDSRSELVVPLIDDGRVLGVLDLDSPVPGRFDEDDRAGCERLVALFLEHQLRWPDAFP